MTIDIAVAVTTLMSHLVPAALLSFILCGVIVWTGPRDAPDSSRKAHHRAVPTTGGIAMVAASCGLAALVASARYEAPFESVFGVSAALLLFAAFGIGLIDDVFDLAAGAKTGLLAGFSLMAAVEGPRPDVFFLPGLGEVPLNDMVAIAGSALFLFVVINAVNFMDGANGLSIGTLIAPLLVCIWLFRDVGVLGPFAYFATIFAVGAIGGFLIWNMAGRLFAGDTGALSLGAFLALLGLAATQASPTVGLMQDGSLHPPVSVWFSATLVLPWVVDVILTLIWRARRGRQLMAAHNEHAYHLLLRAGWSHWPLALVWWGYGGVTALAALWAAQAGPLYSFYVFCALAILSTLVWCVQRAVYWPRVSAPDSQ